MSLDNFVTSMNNSQPHVIQGDLFFVDSLSSIEYKNMYSTIFAAGTCTLMNSAYKDGSYRYFGPFIEVDSGFFAGLSMMNKRVGFKDVPMTTFTVMGNFFAYVGERDPIFTDLIVEGNLAKMQFVVYLYNLEKQKTKTRLEDQIVGVLVCNLPKVHLLMREAMRMGNVIPSIKKFKSKDKKGVTSKDI